MAHNDIFNIKTLRLTDKQIITNIRKTFGLDQPPFNNIDDDLLMLAFIPTCNTRNQYLSKETSNRIKSNYRTCSHQSLEFYGDRVLYAVISSIIFELFGLDNTPEFLTKIVNYLTNNRTLTDLMMNKNACEYVRGPNYTIRQTSKGFHNICADSLEGLIGALFIYLDSNNMDHIRPIKDWLLKNTELAFYLRHYLSDIGRNTNNIYTLPDKQSLIAQVEEARRKDLEDLESLREDLDPQTYQGLYDILSRDVVPTIEEFATKIIIVDPQSSLPDIYRNLGWRYKAPSFFPITETYVMYGLPNGKEKIIGSGLTPDEAVINTRQYLVMMGYIINMKSYA